jgi:hypothetical protein
MPIIIIKKKTEALLKAIKEVGLEVNAGKSNYVFISSYQTKKIIVKR